MAYTANVVKGSADEAILRTKYGDSINYNYTDRNEFVGKDRYETASLYDKAIANAGGSTAKDAGDLWGYSGVTINDGYGPSQPKPVIQQVPQVQNNSAQLEQWFEEQRKAAIAQLKQAIAKGKSEQQGIIDKAPQQFRPLKDSVSANRYKNLSSLREMLANQGQQGGVNRTEETQVNTSAENDINSLNQQQQNVISEAQRAIADLEASGSYEEARIVAQNAADKVRALIDEANRVESASYQRLRDTIGDSQWNKTYDFNVGQAIGNINGIPTLAQREFDRSGEQWQQQFDFNKSEAEWQREFQKMGFNAEQSYRMAQLAASQAKASAPSSSSYNDYYNGFVSEASGEDGEALYKELKSNADAYINNMGQSNYNKALKLAQDKYYDTVVDRWRGNYYALKTELQSKQDYYKDVLGLDNFNRLMNL